jgi:hypothetical protein
LDSADSAGVSVARKIQLSKNNLLVTVIHVTDISPAQAVPDDTFRLKGHEWQRAFTDEVR